MNIYLKKDDNNNSLSVIITDNKTAKILDATHLGVFFDLSDVNVSNQIRNRFSEWKKEGMLKSLYDILNCREVAFSDLAPELEDAAFRSL